MFYLWAFLKMCLFEADLNKVLKVVGCKGQGNVGQFDFRDMPVRFH